MSKDTLSRRIRFAPPEPTDADTIFPQDADLEAWAAISRHGPLPITYLKHFDPRKNYANLQRRYTRFYHHGFIHRPPRQYASFHARYSPLVYDLTPKSKALLEDRVCPMAPSRSAPFVHQLMQACVTASLEILAPFEGYDFIPRHELVKGSLALPLHSTKLVPDDIFALERPDGKRRRFFLEVDRNTESIERSTSSYNTWQKKVQSYDEMFSRGLHKSHYGFPIATVLIVTTNPKHAENLRAYIDKNSKHAERYLLHVEETFGANWRVPKELLNILPAVI